MAAGAKPKGTLPETKVRTEVMEEVVEDVNEDEESSTSKDLEEVDEDILEELEESKKVPYSRFKEVNDKAKSYESQIQELKSKFDQELDKKLKETEHQLAARMKRELQEKDEEILDPWEKEARDARREVQNLKSRLDDVTTKLSTREINDELRSLQEKYPDADREAVMGWARSRDDYDLEKLMKRSHERNMDFVDQKLKSLINERKKRKSSSVPTREGGIRLKPEEKPKSIRDASKMAAAYLRKLTSE